MTDSRKPSPRKAAEKAVSQPAAVEHADVDGDLTPKEQAKMATLTKVQPPGGVSEVLTGTPERPESTRIVPPGEVPASAGETRPAEQRRNDGVSQVAPTRSPVEQRVELHGNADY